MIHDQLEKLLLGLPVAHAPGPVLLGQRLRPLILGPRQRPEDLERRVLLRVLDRLHRARIADDLHDPLAKLLFRGERVDRVVVALGHLLPVEARDRPRLAADHRVGDLEDRLVAPVVVVEPLGQVPRDLHVLPLVFAHGHEVRVNPEDVGRLQNRVVEQPHGGHDAAGDLVLVGRGLVHLAPGADAGEQPRQLMDLRHVVLQIEVASIGIEPEGEVVDDHLPDVPAKLLGLTDRRQGVVLVYDKNPLIFKESTKHKLINLVRVAGLQMQANAPNLDLDDSIFTNEYGAFLPDLWEQTVNSELQRIKKSPQKYHSWFGLVTISNVPELRTKLRMEQLKQMQRDLISAFNPSQFGFPGIIGYHSDYVYSFLIQNKDEQAVQQWSKALKKKFANAFELSNGIHIETGIKVGFVRLDESYDDSYQLLSNAKSALSQALKSNKNEAI